MDTGYLHNLHTNNIKVIRKTFYDIYDMVLDEYLKQKISKIEMKNILNWCIKMKDNLIQQEET